MGWDPERFPEQQQIGSNHYPHYSRNELPPPSLLPTGLLLLGMVTLRSNGRRLAGSVFDVMMMIITMMTMILAAAASACIHPIHSVNLHSCT